MSQIRFGYVLRIFLPMTALACLAGCRLLSGKTAPHPHVIRAIALSYLKPGDQILLMDSGEGIMPEELNQSLVLKSNGSSVPLSSYKQLQGHVVFSDSTDVLAFVRLHTTLGIGDASEGRGEAEITTDRSSVSPGAYTEYGSGLCGILSARAFQLGGFASPVVSQTASGYQVVRWTFDGSVVRKIKEEVGSNGFYAHHVLKQIKPPKLPGTTWRMPGAA